MMRILCCLILLFWIGSASADFKLKISCDEQTKICYVPKESLKRLQLHYEDVCSSLSEYIAMKPLKINETCPEASTECSISLKEIVELVQDNNNVTRLLTEKRRVTSRGPSSI